MCQFQPIFPRDISIVTIFHPFVYRRNPVYRIVYPPEIQSFIKVRCIRMIEIL